MRSGQLEQKYLCVNVCVLRVRVCMLVCEFPCAARGHVCSIFVVLISSGPSCFSHRTHVLKPPLYCVQEKLHFTCTIDRSSA